MPAVKLGEQSATCLAWVAVERQHRGCAMGFALVVGCGLIAFGPSMMLWLLLVGRRPILVIIGIVR